MSKHKSIDDRLDEVLMRLRLGHIYEDQAKSFIQELIREQRADAIESYKNNELVKGIANGKRPNITR